VYNSQFLEGEGPFETRYLAFLEVSSLRPSLHRCCARMTGSVTDGEDVVQEALFEAYRKLDKCDESRPLKPPNGIRVLLACDPPACRKATRSNGGYAGAKKMNAFIAESPAE